MIQAFVRAILLASALAFGATLPLAAWSQAKVPLLIEGKKTLYQRVLTRPGASLSAEAGGAAGKPVPTFSVFYVYGRAKAAGGDWVQVGATSDGKALAWLKAGDAVPWQHTIVAAFANPTDRQGVLFFRNREGLMTAIAAEPAGLEKLRKDALAAKAGGAEGPVIATEPATWVDPQKSFYLLPVLEASTVLAKNGAKVRTVRVASVAGDGGAPAKPATPQALSEEGIANFKSAVVFVVDATSSMQPYIDRQRSAMETILKEAEQTKIADRIRFGIVAFQDDPAKTRGVEYLTKVFAEPNQRLNREQFLAAMQKVTATRNSTRAFAEDSYAALDLAARTIDWRSYGGRYVVFFTDASAREGNSALASTKLSTEQMRTQLQERGIALYVIHLKAPDGQKDHAIAEEQYRRLSDWPGRGSLYFPVEAGDPAKFETDVKRLAKSLIDQVRNPKGLLKARKAPETRPDGRPAPDAIESSTAAVGRAMVLAYLGREQSTHAPSLYEAWASDRDFGNPEIATLSMRVLLTKNQLSDLQTTLRRLVEAGERQQLDGGNLFNQLRSVAAALGRAPERIAQGQVKNLQESGLMGEYLDGLPYRSDLMAITPERWASMPVGQSQAVLDKLKSKIALYQRFHDDVDRWVKLNDAAADGDRVYPVPLDSLP
ncbi:MAG: vWA domain-containing protein [Caldimonas sp.]